MLFPILVVLAAGIALAVQAPTNAMLARQAGSITLAALTSFVVGTLVLAALWAFADRTPPAALRGASWWTLAGGFYGALFVGAMAYAAPRLGLATTLTIAIASQLVAALIFDQFGLLGLRAQPVSLSRLAGAALVIGGVVLVRRG